jgi:hypothetical protein
MGHKKTMLWQSCSKLGCKHILKVKNTKRNFKQLKEEEENKYTFAS